MGYIISLLMILNVIITRESVYNLPAFIAKHANDEQYNVIISAVQCEYRQ